MIVNQRNQFVQNENISQGNSHYWVISGGIGLGSIIALALGIIFGPVSALIGFCVGGILGALFVAEICSRCSLDSREPVSSPEAEYMRAVPQDDNEDSQPPVLLSAEENMALLVELNEKLRVKLGLPENSFSPALSAEENMASLVELNEKLRVKLGLPENPFSPALSAEENMALLVDLNAKLRIKIKGK